jgi:hypothetical protein
MFQYAILCVRAMVRIRRLRYTPEPLSMDVARVDPYRIKVLRKVSSLLISALVDITEKLSCLALRALPPDSGGLTHGFRFL